jgi:hypothetical protein
MHGKRTSSGSPAWRTLISGGWLNKSRSIEVVTDWMGRNDAPGQLFRTAADVGGPGSDDGRGDLGQQPTRARDIAPSRSWGVGLMERLHK